MQRRQWRIVAIPRRFVTRSLGARNDLDAVSINHRDIIGSDADELAVLVVQFQQNVVTIELGVTENVIEFAETCKVWTRETSSS